jgi:hypothetical protein
VSASGWVRLCAGVAGVLAELVAGPVADVTAAPSNIATDRTAKLARMQNSFENTPLGAVRELCIAKLTGD